MKVDPISLAFIQTVIKTAELAKINNIIIEPNKVRAIDDDRTVVIFHDKDVPEMSFGSIGLNRINIFSSRYEIARSANDFELDATVESSDPKNIFARSLTMKGKGIKVDYRCANPLTIQAPKQISDTVKYKITMIPDALVALSKGQSAMSSDEVTFIGDKDGVRFEISDVNSDILQQIIADKAEIVAGDGKDINFSHKYPIKVILPLLKANPSFMFYLTTRGILKTTINGLDVYALPKVV